jgi:hypothetical protein
MSYFLKFVKNIWPCEYTTRDPPSALEGAHASEGPCSISYISFTVNPPLLNSQLICFIFLIYFCMTSYMLDLSSRVY